MRKTAIAAAVLGVLWLAYVVWPFASLYGVVRAAQAGDAAAIAQRVNAAALRRSLTAQLIEAYARVTGKSPDRTGVMAGLAASFTDPLVEKLIASATLTEIMRNGWTVSVLGERPPGFEGLDANTLGNAWQLYFNADYGLGEVRFPVPISKPKEKQFRVRLALNNWTWKLAGLDLPHDLQERLVREFIKQQHAQEKILGQLRRTD